MAAPRLGESGAITDFFFARNPPVSGCPPSGCRSVANDRLHKVSRRGDLNSRPVHDQDAAAFVAR